MTTFAGMTSYLSDALQNAALRNTSFSSPAVVYIALMSAAGTYTAAGTELSGNGYARVAATFAAPSDGTNTSSVQLSAAYQSPTPTADWAAAVAIEIYDALTNGNRLYSGPLASSVTAKAGVPVVISASALTITLGGAQV